MIESLKKARGYAFSQNESQDETGEADIIRLYDTTKPKPSGL